MRKSERVVGVDVPSCPGNPETRDDRRHGSMMSSRRTISRYGYGGCRVGEATHPGPSVLRSNLLKRAHRRGRSRFTQVDSDCEPLLHNGGVASNDSEEETQAVSVQHSPAHSVPEGRVAMPVRQIYLISGSQQIAVHGTVPTDDICEALEFVLTQGDSSGFDAPPSLPPPVLTPPSVLHTQVDSDVDVPATCYLGQCYSGQMLLRPIMLIIILVIIIKYVYKYNYVNKYDCNDNYHYQ